MIEGYLLAGGAARRLGGKKASRELGGRLLCDYPWDLLQRFCARSWVVGRGPDWPRPDWPWIEEPEPGQGPLAALCYALEQSQADWNLVLAVDYPYLSAAELEGLYPLSGSARLPRCQGQEHPLCGFYARAAAPALRACLDRGERGLGRALRTLERVEWVEFSDPEPFLNVNRPSDWERARNRC